MSSITKTLLITTFATSFVFAQSHTAPNPATMAQHRVKFLTTLLTLNASQQTSATTIFTNQYTANAAPQASLRTYRQNLKTAIQNNDAGSMSQAANQIGTLTAQITLTDAQADAQFYQILSPVQQTQWTQYQGHGFGGRGAFRGARQ
jgi:Spy/CpxP family protein refolding chaperone